MTQYELLQNLFGNLRDFHGLKVNGCIELKAIEYVLPQIQLMAERVGHFCFVLLSYQLDKTDETDEEDEDETDEEDEDALDHMFLKSSTFEVSQVNSMLVHLLLMITPVSLEVMHICSTILEASKSAEVGHFIKQLLEASPDILREHLIHLQQHMVNAIARSTSAEVSILIRNLEENSTDEENMKKISGASQDLLENIELLKEDLRHVFLKSPADSSQLCFPMSDGPLLTLLLRNLNDLLNSNAYSVALIKEEISRVKEDLEHIRSFFGNVEQELHRDLWTRVLDVAYEAEHAINSILARDYGFEEEKEWIFQKLTSGPAEVDVISIVGMPGLGKTTLAYRVYTEKSVVGHFDVRAWCTVDQERNEKKLLQKVFNEVIGLKERVSEDDIDDDVTDKLRRQLFGKSRVILTSRKREVALHGKFHSDPLDLRLLRPEESWELFEKKVFGEERCPDELKDVGEKIAEKCDGLPLVLDLIGGVISRKEKKEALWIEVLNNLSSFIFKDEEEVMKVIQLSYDHLSDHLKPCFLYLASYPKDEDIDFCWLKELWSDEGHVEPTALKSVEEVTEIYVDELISSSLVIVKGGSEQSCQIHDLVHDFCSIKARKEKLFDLSIVLSSSSSDLMLRRRTISFDEGIHSYDSSCFSPEKRNPCAKHLPSLKIQSGFLYNWHLRHLRLLKRLELRYIMLTDTAMNEIGMLVHLRCLRIWMDANALPLSFSNLCNLETLVVESTEPNLVLSPTIWSLAKLRYVQIQRTCSVFGSDIHKPAKLENLHYLFSSSPVR
ncbi:hypothetical protein CQW23_13216 [Capsicum baccatum]|uniref:NB-ARC domain-containing protein n=1 Tax=Capsicum baccatum TaxID=33114 RepID=A0A2G2WUS2_CAPBA|nr:hypothetical protein CQW23_13216 [Capsicum baccatum]